MTGESVDIGDQARGWFKELKNHFKQRRPQYRKAIVSGGYSRAGGVRTLVQATAYAWFSARLPKDDQLDYPRFSLFRRRLSLDEFWNCFEELVRNQTLTLPNESPMRFGGKLEMPAAHSGQTYPFFSNWPFLVSRLSATPDGRLFHEKLSAPKVDLFPGPLIALEEWTGVTPGYSGYSPAVYWVFPDFRARIDSVSIGTESVRVKAATGPAGKGPLSVTYYAKAEGQPPKHGREAVTKGVAKCEVGYAPERFVVDLYDSRTKEPLDWRDFDVRSSLSPADIQFTSRAENLRNLIRGGESLYVEFKERLPTEELAESVCAFANTKGGTIVVGIDKNSKIKGFSHPKYGQDHVDNVISSTLDPVPKYAIRAARLDRRPLILIEVPEGEAKPYTLRQRGVFVRSNATDRIADRNETLGLCRPKQE